MVDNMTRPIQFWLTLSPNRVPKVTKGRPSMYADERCIKMQVTLPKNFFVVPEYTARIAVEEGEAPQPLIDLDVASAAVSEALGGRVVIEAVIPDEQEQSNG